MDSAVVRLGKISLLCVFFAFTSWAQTTNNVVVPAGSVWAYLNQEQSPTADWKEINYHQSGWSTGRAPLGYGDGDEATTTRTNPPPHPATAYFRHSFLSSTNLPVTKIRLLRDDGAVVYLNGREVLRDNMPDGQITPTTLASSTTGPETENQFREFSIAPVSLLQTTNVIAVEVHQASVASSDLGFDLELIVGIPEPPKPVVAIRATQSSTSEPIPTAFIIPGRFEVSRTNDDLTLPLQVNLAYEGSASAADYEPLPTTVTIPPGESSIAFNVLARSDDLVEGTEVVVARIVQSNSLDPATGNRPYSINPERSRAEVRIADEDAPSLPVVSLVTVVSQTKEAGPNEDVAGGLFRLRRTGSTDRALSVLLLYEGTATPETDYNRLPQTVTFAPGASETNLQVFAHDDNLVEDTETVVANLIYPPDATLFPGYIIDPNANAGTVRILDNDSPQVATLRITGPANGSVHRPGEPIEITAVAIDPLGYIPRVEFFADGTRIGVSEIAFLVPPDPGTPITHTVTWSDAAAGEHVLLARARDSRGNIVTSPEVRITVAPDEPRVFVSVTATDPYATELPIFMSAIDPAIFEITRTGGTNSELVVFFSLHGTAQEGVDYVALEKRAVIPAGRRSTTIMITPIPDPLAVVERMETVGIRLEPSPDLRPIPMYEITPGRSEAAAVIFDREPDPNAANIAFAFPDENERLELNVKTTLLVAVYHATQDATHVDFFLDGEKIGSSDVIVPPDEPGGLVFHRLEWQAAPTGQHQLKAVAVFANGLHMETFPLPILIGGEAGLPLVSVRFVPPSTEPFPNADHARGSFQFVRNGPTNESLTIHFETSGTATEGVDYVSFSNRVTIPAGQLAQELKVQAIDDLMVEGEESVLLKIIPPPPGASPYIVSIQNDRALVPIFDNDNSPAQIVITKPANGQLFPLGVPIDIEATATDPNGYIPRVEFYANDRLIGVSEIVFVRAPDPGTPIHHSMVWSNAPAGEHSLTARSVDSAGQQISSNPVRITVRFAPDTTLLSVEVIDAEASEPGSNNSGDPAIFRVRRVSGPTNEMVSFAISLTGSAANRVDYENVFLSHNLSPGQRTADIVISPIQDAVTEGEETVILKLIPNCNIPLAAQGKSLLPFAPIMTPYCIIGPDIAQAIIRDNPPGTNPPPRVTITSPRDGAVFEPGRPIFIGATAIDNGGPVSQFDLYAGERLLWRTNGSALAFMWSNAPAGQHTLRAIAVDALGAKGQASIRILVRESNAAFVERELPDSYLPGTPLIVRLLANPPPGTRAWGVEDQPPRGWIVTEISHRGVFDPATGKVKFGHFTEILNAQTLSYVVTPPANASGEYEFTGNSSADGASFAITGDRVLHGTVQEHHPADTNHDKRIVLVELTAYAATWKSGNPFNTIPVGYVTRAAMIWRNGETYHFTPGTAAPGCWAPDAGDLRPLATTVGNGAVRSCAAQVVPGAAFEITIAVQPPGGSSAFAIEERVPSGWTPTNISHDGSFDAAAGVIRWGVFLDADARTLRYSLTAPSGITSAAQFHGEVSFDGGQERITGSDRVLAADASVAFGLTHCERQADGTVELRLGGASGQLCVLEVSTDLQAWTAVSEVFLPDGELTFLDDDAAGGPRRFYRLRVR